MAVAQPMSRRYNGFQVRAVPYSCVCGGPLAWELEFDDGISTPMGCICHHPFPDQVEVLCFLFKNRHVCQHLTFGELAYACGLDAATAAFIIKASFPLVQPKELE